jgi:hypothetical protein
MILVVLIPEKYLQLQLSKPVFKIISNVKQHLGAQFKTKVINHYYYQAP